MTDTLSTEEKKRLLELMKEKAERIKFNQILQYEPYPWQEHLINSSEDNSQMLAMCANRVGKSFTGAFIMACHLTGRYPDWWEGHKFDRPINAWACGKSNETTRDVVQSELLGKHDDILQRGTAAIPKDCIGETTRKPGVPNALNSVLIKHHDSNGKFDGYSRLGFKAYEMGQEKFMGTAMDWIWLDEEPPQDIFTQCVTRTATTGGKVLMTFTPESGVTPVVNQFMNDLKPGQYLIQATWEDVTEKLDEDGNVTQKGHLNTAIIEQLLAVYTPHEREMRSKGIPVFGSGMVFPIPEENITIEPFELPEHWPRIAAIDFGWDHPTACVWLAYDTEADTVYLYDTYAKSKETAIIHAAAINSRERWIPLAWPKDGLQSDKGSGISLADQYRSQGCNMLPDFFRNPPAIGEKNGSVFIEPGIMEMLHRMETGRFKVFSTLHSWFQEYRQYHRKEGKIVPINDDLMSATRYAAQSLRYAVSGSADRSGYNLPRLEYTDNGYV